MSRFLKLWRNRSALLAGVLLSLPLLSAQAADKRCLVIHVMQDDPKAFAQALNMVSNVPKALGIDNVDVELVAQGPGLKLLTAQSPQLKRVESLGMYGAKFSACGNTMDTIKRKTGKEPVLLKNVQRVPAGAIRVMELQEKGCSYIRS